jgi:O-antigen/teichoic acid export membrane protein
MLVGIFFSVSTALFLAARGFSITWLLFAQSWGGFLTTAILFLAFLLENRSIPEKTTSTRRVEKTKRGPWGGEAWRALGQDAWPYAITFASAVVWQRLDQIVASRMLGLEAAGQYALAVRLVAIPILIATSVSLAAFPDLQRIGRDAPEKIIPYFGALSKFLYRYGVFLSAAMLFAVAVLVRPLVPKYGPALHLLAWFIPGIWAFWIHSVILNVLFALRRYWAVVSAHLWALGSYLVLLPLLAKLFGLPGVALGCNVFPLVLLIVCLIKLRETEMVGKRFSLFTKFTAVEIDLLQNARERFFPARLRRR